MKVTWEARTWMEHNFPFGQNVREGLIWDSGYMDLQNYSMELQNVKPWSLCLDFLFLFQSVNLSGKEKSRNWFHREYIRVSKSGMILLKGMAIKVTLAYGFLNLFAHKGLLLVGAGTWPRTHFWVCPPQSFASPDIAVSSQP